MKITIDRKGRHCYISVPWRCFRTTSGCKNVKTLSENPAVPYLTLSPAYVTGLCEAVGSFTYGREPGGIRLRFDLGLPDADKALIFGIKDFFGVGALYWKTQNWAYCVTKTEELKALISHFDAMPLRGRKEAVYRIWRQMVELKQGGDPASTGELQDLARQLSALNRGRNG